eukprot:Nk52_evm3s454 gene=Nk52_evmTU3s454
MRVIQKRVSIPLLVFLVFFAALASLAACSPDKNDIFPLVATELMLSVSAGKPYDFLDTVDCYYKANGLCNITRSNIFSRPTTCSFYLYESIALVPSKTKLCKRYTQVKLKLKSGSKNTVKYETFFALDEEFKGKTTENIILYSGDSRYTAEYRYHASVALTSPITHVIKLTLDK